MLKSKAMNIYLVTWFVVLVGCSTVTSHYDEQRQQNFTNLKAYHVALIDDNTEGPGIQWNEQSVRDYCSVGDRKYNDAYDYAKSKDTKDMTASKAVEYLRQQFRDDCQQLLDKQKLFSAVFAGELKSEIIQQYDYAIAGEESRVGGQN